jgi:predicted Zn-dependent protease
MAAFAAVGCHTIVAPTEEPPSAPLRVTATPPDVVPASATQPPTPNPSEDHLALAAACTERGDQPAAASHLEQYVKANPDQLMFRAHLAELLFKIDQPERAKFHFEKFISDAQTATGPVNKHLVHCHTRLMEIGGRADDRHAEMLHRGIGLLILVKQTEGEDEFREEMLCKAIKALLEAAEAKPTDARVQLYLSEAHALTGNRRAADTARDKARSLATPGTLTLAESRRLAIR